MQLILTLFALLSMAIWPAMGFAAEAGVYAIDATPAFEAVLSAVVTVLAAGALWLGRKIAHWLDGKGLVDYATLEAKYRASFEEAVWRALDYAQTKARAAGEDLARIETRSKIVADAANYLLPKIPETLEFFKIDPAGLRERLEARLGDHEAGATVTVRPMTGTDA